MPVQRVVRVVATALTLVVVLGTGIAWSNVRSFEDGIFHMSAPSLGKGGDDGAIDILLVGLDSRTDAHGNPLSAEELATRIKEGAIPIISDVEGFMAYYVVYAPDDTVTAISLFNNYAGAEEANRRALAWIEQDLAPLLVGPATAMAGPVIVHTLA